MELLGTQKIKSLQNLILSSKAVRLCFCEAVVMESTKSISDTLFLVALKIATEKLYMGWMYHVYFALNMQDMPWDWGDFLSFNVYLNGN